MKLSFGSTAHQLEPCLGSARKETAERRACLFCCARSADLSQVHPLQTRAVGFSPAGRSVCSCAAAPLEPPERAPRPSRSVAKEGAQPSVCTVRRRCAVGEGAAAHSWRHQVTPCAENAPSARRWRPGEREPEPEGDTHGCRWGWAGVAARMAAASAGRALDERDCGALWQGQWRGARPSGARHA